MFSRKKRKHVTCCVPLSWSYVPRHFFISMLKMKNYGIRHDTFDLNFAIVNSCYLDQARDNLVNAALGTDSEYLLWLDADQVYPQDTPEVLMKHIDAGKLVVGGITPRRDSGKPLIYKRIGDSYTLIRDEVKGIIKVDAMGMGGIMIHRDVFDTLDPPYFMMRWENGKYVGEDISFYDKCAQAGIDVWCDTSLRYTHLDLKEVQLIEA